MSEPDFLSSAIAVLLHQHACSFLYLIIEPPQDRTWEDISLAELYDLVVEQHDPHCSRKLIGTPCIGTWFNPHVTTNPTSFKAYQFDSSNMILCKPATTTVYRLLNRNPKWFLIPGGDPDCHVCYVFDVGSPPLKRRTDSTLFRTDQRPVSKKVRREQTICRKNDSVLVNETDITSKGTPQPQLCTLIKALENATGGIFLDTSRLITELERLSSDGHWAFVIHVPAIVSWDSPAIPTLLDFWRIPKDVDDNPFRDKMYTSLDVVERKSSEVSERLSPSTLLVFHLEVERFGSGIYENLSRAISSFVHTYGDLGFTVDGIDSVMMAFNNLMEQVQNSGTKAMLCASNYDFLFTDLFAREAVGANDSSQSSREHRAQFGKFTSSVGQWYKLGVIEKVLYQGQTPSLMNSFTSGTFFPNDISDNHHIAEIFAMPEKAVKGCLELWLRPLLRIPSVSPDAFSQYVQKHFEEVTKVAAYRKFDTGNRTYITSQVIQYLEKLANVPKDKIAAVDPSTLSPDTYRSFDPAMLDVVGIIARKSGNRTQNLIIDALVGPDSQVVVSPEDLRCDSIRASGEAHITNTYPADSSKEKYHVLEEQQAIGLMYFCGMLVEKERSETDGELLLSIPNKPLWTTLSHRLKIIYHYATRIKPLVDSPNLYKWQSETLNDWLQDRSARALMAMHEATPQGISEMLINMNEITSKAQNRAMIEVEVMRSHAISKIFKIPFFLRTAQLEEKKKSALTSKDPNYIIARERGWFDMSGGLRARGFVDLAILAAPKPMGPDSRQEHARHLEFGEFKIITLRTLWRALHGESQYKSRPNEEELETFRQLSVSLLRDGGADAILSALPASKNIQELYANLDEERKKNPNRYSWDGKTDAKKVPVKELGIEDLFSSWRNDDGTFSRKSVVELLLEARIQVLQYANCAANGTGSKGNDHYMADSRINGTLKLTSKTGPPNVSCHVVLILGGYALVDPMDSFVTHASYALARKH